MNLNKRNKKLHCNFKIMINKWNTYKLLENVYVNNYNGHLNNNLLLIVISLLKEYKMYIINKKILNKYNVISLLCIISLIYRD
jgi:hypothetical protein